MADYISAQEAADKWGLTRRQIQPLCATGKIEGTKKFNNSWMIPANTENPLDGRHL